MNNRNKLIELFIYIVIVRMKKKVIVNPKIAKIDGQGSKPPPSVLGLQSVNKAN